MQNLKMYMYLPKYMFAINIRENWIPSIHELILKKSICPHSGCNCARNKSKHIGLLLLINFKDISPAHCPHCHGQNRQGCVHAGIYRAYTISAGWAKGTNIEKHLEGSRNAGWTLIKRRTTFTQCSANLCLLVQHIQTGLSANLQSEGKTTIWVIWPFNL